LLSTPGGGVSGAVVDHNDVEVGRGAVQRLDDAGDRVLLVVRRHHRERAALKAVVVREARHGRTGVVR
jgi:hypothetical protein